MAYIVGADRYQTRMVTTSLDDLISKDNSVRVIDSYVGRIITMSCDFGILL